MGDEVEDDLWYPTVDDVLVIHEDIIREDPNAVAGVQDASRLEFAIDFVRGDLGEEPATVHEKAFHLMRLIASNHWFADGNKRTALNVTELFYLVNGYDLSYGDDFRSLLKLLSVREDLIDRTAGPAYLRDRTETIEIDVDELDPGEALAVLIVALVAMYSEVKTDVKMEDLLSESEYDVESVREEFGLTTEYGTTVNLRDDETRDEDGG